ncbi:MAG: hypothetical protein JO056_08415 [Alphaproteobacteria bacterium]|nr:hypothetical protein [Alphaproteobacteria bacterium]
MKKMVNLVLGAAVAAALIAPVWADAQKVAHTGMVVRDVVSLPVVWQSAVAVVHSVSFFTP